MPEAAFDLLGDSLPLERKNDRPEAAALAEVLRALETHNAVAWVHRMNSGAFRRERRAYRKSLVMETTWARASRVPEGMASDLG